LVSGSHILYSVVSSVVTDFSAKVHSLEVDELLGASILPEVHFQTALSNANKIDDSMKLES
jgi:hypothetical protein